MTISFFSYFAFYPSLREAAPTGTASPNASFAVYRTYANVKKIDFDKELSLN
jgi:hypothetical protein